MVRLGGSKGKEMGGLERGRLLNLDKWRLQLYEIACVRYGVVAMTRTDVQLMLDVKGGDQQSFELLLQRYRTPLVNFLYRMVRNREQAEDLAQEVFLRVYRAREDYEPSAKFTTRLFRIATNLALNSVRDHRYQKLEVSIDAPVTIDAEDGDEKLLDVPEKHPNIY